MNRFVNFALSGIAVLLGACAHPPSQYGGYSSSGGYYPTNPNNGYYRNNGYSQYSRPYYPRPAQPYGYRAYPPAYPAPYSSNSVNNTYYYQNNNVYRPVQAWPHAHHDDHRGEHYPSPYRYQHSDGHRYEHDRDDRYHHDANNRNWHDHKRSGNGSPPSHHDGDGHDRPYYNAPNGRPYVDRRPGFHAGGAPNVNDPVPVRPNKTFNGSPNRSQPINARPEPVRFVPDYNEPSRPRPQPMQAPRDDRNMPILRNENRGNNEHESGRYENKGRDKRQGVDN